MRVSKQPKVMKVLDMTERQLKSRATDLRAALTTGLEGKRADKLVKEQLIYLCNGHTVVSAREYTENPDTHYWNISSIAVWLLNRYEDGFWNKWTQDRRN